jgi:DNA helicase-2/ATP-dependent DNA helicase PcrA
VGVTRAERKLFISHAEQRRRNGELMSSKPSSFLGGLPDDLVDRKKTVKSRSMGRGYMGAGASSSASYRGDRSWGSSRYDRAESAPPTAGARRPGTPLERTGWAAEAEASQDAAHIALGSRVRPPQVRLGHDRGARGHGRDLKAKIDFDDETIGRKTLVVAQANLEQAID